MRQRIIDHRVTGTILIMLSALPVAPVYANDSTAEYETGGLRFKQDPDIEMKSEDLFISTSQIRIGYVFVNHGKSNKTVLIAFPLPDITGSMDFTNGLPSENADNPFDFYVKSDGKPVALTLDQRILLIGDDKKEKDYTEKLRSAHIPFMPVGKATGKALDLLPEKEKAEYVSTGLALVDEYSDKPNGPMVQHLTPVWTLRMAFTWQQTFPAGQEVRLEQSYKPSIGGTVQTPVGLKDWKTAEYSANYRSKYCIDESLVKTIERAQTSKRADVPPFSEERISYILKTGANWAGPIGSFHLTVDKGTPEKLVSFCAEGVKKISPTQFEVRTTNFTPKQDLNILLLSPLSCGEVSCH